MDLRQLSAAGFAPPAQIAHAVLPYHNSPANYTVTAVQPDYTLPVSPTAPTGLAYELGYQQQPAQRQPTQQGQPSPNADAYALPLAEQFARAQVSYGAPSEGMRTQSAVVHSTCTTHITLQEPSFYTTNQRFVQQPEQADWSGPPRKMSEFMGAGMGHPCVVVDTSSVSKPVLSPQSSLKRGVSNEYVRPYPKQFQPQRQKRNHNVQNVPQIAMHAFEAPPPPNPLSPHSPAFETVLLAPKKIPIGERTVFYGGTKVDLTPIVLNVFESKAPPQASPTFDHVNGHVISPKPGRGSPKGGWSPGRGKNPHGPPGSFNKHRRRSRASQKSPRRQGKSKSPRPPKARPFKTTSCQYWMNRRACPREKECGFAHGDAEMQPLDVTRFKGDKYKNRGCHEFLHSDTCAPCPYSALKCNFCHDEEFVKLTQQAGAVSDNLFYIVVPGRMAAGAVMKVAINDPNQLQSWNANSKKIEELHKIYQDTLQVFLRKS